MKIKSAFILPHLGSATKDTRIAMANLGIDNIDEFFKKGNCKKEGQSIFISSFHPINRNDEEDLTNHLAWVGPISLGIDADDIKFYFYSSGVHFGSKCSSIKLNHAVVAVGYGTDSVGGDYYIVKNSWGTDWGEGGYIKMARNRNNNCGIASLGYYPIA